MPNRLASWGLSNFSKVITGGFISETILGIYNTSSSFSNLISVLGNSLGFAFQPWVFQSMEKGKQGKENISKAVNLSCDVFLLIAFGVSFFIKDIYGLFVHISYHDGILYVPLLAFASALSCYTVISIYVLFYNKDLTKYVTISTIIGATVNIVASLILMQFLSIYGIIIASYLSSLSVHIYISYIVSKKEEISISVPYQIILNLIGIVISYGVYMAGISLVNRIFIFIAVFIAVLLLNKKNVLWIKNTFLSH